jgi:hypothetical protein
MREMIRFLLILSIFQLTYSFADWMTKDYCRRSILPGEVIMNAEVFESPDRAVRVLRGNTELKNGDTYTPGEVLTVQITDSSPQYLFEVSAGKFEKGGCDGVRIANKPSTSLTMPTAEALAESSSPDNVAIKVAWATGHSAVAVSPAFIMNPINLGGQGSGAISNEVPRIDSEKNQGAVEDVKGSDSQPVVSAENSTTTTISTESTADEKKEEVIKPEVVPKQVEKLAKAVINKVVKPLNPPSSTSVHTPPKLVDKLLSHNSSVFVPHHENSNKRKPFQPVGMRKMSPEDMAAQEEIARNYYYNHNQHDKKNKNNNNKYGNKKKLPDKSEIFVNADKKKADVIAAMKKKPQLPPPPPHHTTNRVDRRGRMHNPEEDEEEIPRESLLVPRDPNSNSNSKENNENNNEKENIESKSRLRRRDHKKPVTKDKVVKEEDMSMADHIPEDDHHLDQHLLEEEEEEEDEGHKNRHLEHILGGEDGNEEEDHEDLHEYADRHFDKTKRIHEKQRKKLNELANKRKKSKSTVAVGCSCYHIVERIMILSNFCFIGTEGKNPMKELKENKRKRRQEPHFDQEDLEYNKKSKKRSRRYFQFTSIRWWSRVFMGLGLIFAIAIMCGSCFICWHSRFAMARRVKAMFGYNTVEE